jgi:hypothetical protein
MRLPGSFFGEKQFFSLFMERNDDQDGSSEPLI